MAFPSTSQLHPTALHSLAKLQPSSLLFLRRSNSALPTRKPRFFTTVIGISPTTATTLLSYHSASSSPPLRWIDKWKQSRSRKLPKRPRAVVDYRGSGMSEEEEEFGTSRSTGSSTMERIVEKLKKFGYVEDVEERTEVAFPEKGSVEDVFYAEDGVLPNSKGGLPSYSAAEEVIRFPWEKPREEATGVASARRKASKCSLAELTLPEGELRRLRHLAIRTKSKTKIGGAGVTKEIVDKIHDKWKTEEVVRLKCEGPPTLNMKRMHEILERKTGGLVIWRSGSSISLYRGVSYELPQMEKKRGTHFTGLGSTNKANSISYPGENVNGEDAQALTDGEASYKKNNNIKSHTDLKYAHEVDSLLDDLGPRYTDWPGCDPLPVDADLLPGYIPDYKPPFRILPYGVKRSLGMKDQTGLRRLARLLPPHFALGRSRQLQGLATAMVKLWEKSTVAKIALKRGVQLTTSERMAEDIKKLTGGTLLCRNKDYIVFYRGKDFLAPVVTEALLERERLAKALQDEEEQARAKASFSVFSNISTGGEPGTAGTLTETKEADARWGKQLDNNEKDKMIRAAEIARHANLVRKLERKLFLSEKKLAKAERALGKVEEFLKPSDNKPDSDGISDEERFMFRKLGLKMKAFLLLGRRGVFDGTVENMHLHWKYRELVKIIVKAKTFAQVRNVALSLEAESGGVLVSVDKVSKGFAIIVYRGKDYHRPRSLRPKNLLTKRKALARSIELQRREALKGHILNMHKRVNKLRSELDLMEAVEGNGDEELYAKLDSAYPSGDEETEDEDDEAYLENDNDDGNVIKDVSLENAVDNGDNDSNDDGANGDDEGSSNAEDDDEESCDCSNSAINTYKHHISSSSDSESSVVYNSHQ